MPGLPAALRSFGMAQVGWGNYIMRKNLFSFLLGTVAGVALGIWFRDEDKQKVGGVLCKQARRWLKVYAAWRREGLDKLREGVAKVKERIWVEDDCD